MGQSEQDQLVNAAVAAIMVILRPLSERYGVRAPRVALEKAMAELKRELFPYHLG